MRSCIALQVVLSCGVAWADPATSPSKEAVRQKLARSSFAPATLPRGEWLVDVSSGFPSLLSLGLTTGLLRQPRAGLSLGLELRSSVYRTDVMGTLGGQRRIGEWLGLGGQISVGGGGGPRGRNGVYLEAGPGVLVWVRSVFRVGVRVFYSFADERNCPSAEEAAAVGARGDLALAAEFTAPTHEWDACAGRAPRERGIYPHNALADAAGYNPVEMTLSKSDRYPDSAHIYGGTYVLERYQTHRGLARLVLDTYLTPRINLWSMLDVAFAGGDHLAIAGVFHSWFTVFDHGLYGRIGLTIKL